MADPQAIAIGRSHAGLSGEPAFNHAGQPATGFHRPLTSILGREEEIQLARELLIAGNAPLVTLTGPGGVGKTRLAQEIALVTEPHFADGVAFVDLAAIQHSSGVLDAIAQAAGVRASERQPVSIALAAFLRHQQHRRIETLERAMGVWQNCSDHAFDHNARRNNRASSCFAGWSALSFDQGGRGELDVAPVVHPYQLHQPAGMLKMRLTGRKRQVSLTGVAGGAHMVASLIDALRKRLNPGGKRPGGGTPDRGNSPCAHFCNQVFPPGPERGRCVSDAARNVPGNLCDACGADAGRVCAGPGGSMTCCGPDQTCDSATGTCSSATVECTYQQCLDETGNPNAACCGTECGLIVLAPCDPDDDRCCGTLNGNPEASHCADVSDRYPDIGHRCCLGSNSHPCSGIGGHHCEPNSDCSTCCSGYCGPIIDEPTGTAVCIDRT